MLAQFIFFLGLLVYCLLALSEDKKKIGFPILLCATIIAFICVILCFAYGAGYLQFAQGKINDGYKAIEGMPEVAVAEIRKGLDASQHALTSQIFSKIISLFIFGIVPILYTLKHLIFKSDK